MYSMYVLIRQLKKQCITRIKRFTDLIVPMPVSALTYVCRCELELPTCYRVAHATSHTNAALNSAPSISGSTLRLLTEVES